MSSLLDQENVNPLSNLVANVHSATHSVLVAHINGSTKESRDVRVRNDCADAAGVVPAGI